MIKHQSELVLEISARDPDTLENDLNTAEQIIRSRASAKYGSRHGILVTRHDFTRYTVALSRDVPYGQTHERRENSDGI